MSGDYTHRLPDGNFIVLQHNLFRSTRRNNEGYDIVEDDFNLVCYDMVSNPSTSGAYMNLKESVEYRTLVSQNRLVLLDEILNDILDL